MNKQGLKDVQHGEFGADMQVALVNEGPVSYTHLDVYKRQVFLAAHLLEPVADLAFGLAGAHDLEPVTAGALIRRTKDCLLYTSTSAFCALRSAAPP